jgi:multiple sugar transport system substrate-binding protein
MLSRFLLSAAITSSLLVAGCSGVSLPGQSSGPVTLTFWNGFTASDRQFVEQIVNTFNQNHKDVQINMTIEPWDSIYQKLQAGLTTGSGPDIAGMDPSLLAQYATSGAVQPLDDAYNQGLLDKNVIPPAFTSLATINGHMYAAPMTLTPIMFFYNKAMFQKAGISQPPATMDDMWKDAEALTTNGANGQQYGLMLADHGVVQWWAILASAYGGGIVSPDGKQSMLNDPHTVAAFKALQDAMNSKQISPVGVSGADGDQIFQTQKVAMLMNGPWVTSGFTQAGLEYDAVPIPVGPSGKPTSLLAGAIMVLGKGSKHSKEAFEFMQYWNTKEAQAIYANGAGSSPARTDMADTLSKDNPFPAKFAGQLATGQFYLAGLKNESQADSDIITPAVQAILRGQPVDSTLSQANDKLNALLQQG